MYNIVRNGSLWSNLVFEKEVVSHSNIKILQAWSLILGIWKHTNLAIRAFFPPHNSLATAMTNWALTFTDLLFCAFDEIHQVRIMVFDNNHWCPVPLNKNLQVTLWSYLDIVTLVLLSSGRLGLVKPCKINKRTKINTCHKNRLKFNTNTKKMIICLHGDPVF